MKHSSLMRAGAVLAGLIGHRGDACLGGELRFVGKALAHAAQLGQDLRRADAPGARNAAHGRQHDPPGARDAARALHPEVMLITGDMASPELTALAALGYPVLHKPVTPTRLRRTLDTLWQHAERDSELTQEALVAAAKLRRAASGGR